MARCGADLRLVPEDAARLLRERFSAPLLLGRKVAHGFPTSSARWGSRAVRSRRAGRLAAAEHEAQLATRDARARATYEAVGARVVIAR